MSPLLKNILFILYIHVPFSIKITMIVPSSFNSWALGATD